MAVATVQTIIANPARKQGKRKAKARKGGMTAKQIKYFGTARQRAALKAKRRKPKAKAKANPARKRSRTTPRKAVHRKRSTPRRKNPGEIISLVLGNPAKRRKKAVATTKKRKKASARRHTNAGRRTAKKNPAKMHHRRRTHRNPAGMGVTDLVALGGGAMLGGAVPSVLSQAVLKEKNTGLMGYAANLAATFLLAWGAHKVAKGRLGESFAKGILAGGIGSVIKRAVTDYSLLGQYGQTLGLGDYMVANFTNPPRVADGLNSPMYEIPAGGWAPTTVVAAPGGGMGCYAAGPLYG